MYAGDMIRIAQLFPEELQVSIIELIQLIESDNAYSMLIVLECNIIIMKLMKIEIIIKV
jgi:hypothetical protein